MTDASELQSTFRDLEVQAQVHAETLEMLKSRVLSRFTVADHAQDVGSVSGGPQAPDPRREPEPPRVNICTDAIREGLRTAFVHDHLDACKLRT